MYIYINIDQTGLCITKAILVLIKNNASKYKFSNGHEEYKTDSTCVSRKKAHSIRRIVEGIRCQIVVIVPYSYIFFLVSDVHIYVMVDGVGGDMVCDQNTLHGHPLSDKRYRYVMVS